MQFRCYHCKFLMHDGMPPMEALSTQQATYLGVDAPEVDRYSVLEGTPYEGLSIYNFCAFCTTALREYPSGIFYMGDHKTSMNNDRHFYRWLGMDCSCCGPIYRKYKEEDASWERFDDTLCIRSSLMHHIEVAYTNTDLSEIRALMGMEV